MLRLKDGDDLALNSLMARWKEALISFIYRYTGDRETAVDLAQETFIRIYRSRQSYREKGKFSTYLFTIAANLSRNHDRWRKRHPTVAFDRGPLGEPDCNQAELLEDEADTPDTASQKEDQAKQIRMAVQTLPHDLRTAVLLFEFEDLSYCEVAEILNCSEKAVETRLYRARKLLRRKLVNLFNEE